MFVAPIDVYLDDRKNAFQPDLIFISNENQWIIKEEGIYGSPDLVLEVLSKDPKFRPHQKEKDLRKSGVKEYWVVDAKTKCALVFS